ncbi:squalene synthase HpnC [Actinoallomurus sp. NBC_01490]|uniref:squalene synthase HpnC n=1 Tax=Actinoallomurus sp. NBC_01490 TaxID=2903557 RepID=UPI002E362759|nr:squalene synthase HpnC [Actinoallomurus sp. NBC_01490]
MLSSVPTRRDVVRKARHENFPVASRLLPRRYRGHLMNVYRFARSVDDAGDETAPAWRLSYLDSIDADLTRLYAGSAPRLPFIRALADTVEACAIPPEPFRRLVEANRRDQSVPRYTTFDELLGYCELSANPVGHIVLHVFGRADPSRFALSDHVCTALQIIEHCQDVAEDHARGRVYLPAEDLRRFGATEEDLVRAPTPVPLRRVLALQTRRAKALLDSGGPLAASLTGFARLAVAGYVAGGRAAVAALERADHDVVGRAVRPATRRLLAEWPVAAVGRTGLGRKAAR